MTHTEMCKEVARKLHVPEDQVRAVVDQFVTSLHQALIEGDEIQVRGLGKFYAKNYHVPKIELEFGNKSKPGERRRIRFRPFDSTNIKLTEGWKASKKK